MRYKLSPVTGRMLRRRTDLINLGQWRSAHGVVVSDLANLAWVMADCLAFGRHGADYETFTKLARSMRVFIPEDVAMDAIRLVANCMEAKGQNYEPFNNGTAGRMLDLNVIELQEARISTMSAVDEFEEQTKARRRENRAALARERKRLRRQAAGAKPREVYEAESASAARPWETFGISRRQWERRGKPTMSQVPAHDTTEMSQVRPHDTNGMSQVRPHNVASPAARHNGDVASMGARHSSYREEPALATWEDEAAPESPLPALLRRSRLQHQPAWHAP